MGAMVGGGTGAVMTAATMTFEMTLDYGIEMPMILAVASSMGVRRLLSRENIYKLKPARRGRTIPKARHSNMFLVRHAREVMDSDVHVLPAEDSFDGFLSAHSSEGRLRHVVVTKEGHIIGVIRVNTVIRRGLAHGRLARRCRQREFTIVGEDAVVSDVIERMWRKHAIMAVVVRGLGHAPPRGKDVAGVITKEHVADSVAEGLSIYPRERDTRGPRQPRAAAHLPPPPAPTGAD